MPFSGRPQRPLGVHVNTSYTSHVLALDPGDAVVVSTDGVIEATDESGELYTPERFCADLCELREKPPAEIVCAVKERVDAFAGAAPRADDVTILALRWQGPAVL
jgi:sigma-B regulation protein RsbU (phosphoserine phosphatase)